MSLPDTFTAADNTVLSTYDALWVKKPVTTNWGGTAKILSNKVIYSSGGYRCAYYYNQAVPSDYEVSCDVTISGDVQFAGPMVSVSSSAETGYTIYIAGKGGPASVYRSLNGAVTTPASSASALTWTDGSTHALKLSKTGAVIKIFWDGAEILSWTDPSPLPDGFAGLHTVASTGASYDNFNISYAVGASTQITATTADVTFSGESVGYVATSSTQITATTADAVFSGGSVGDSSAGTVTTSEFKNESGTLLTALSVDKVWAIQLSGTPTFSSAVTNGAGQLVLSGAALTPGVDYLIVSANADGSALGVTKYTAS